MRMFSIKLLLISIPVLLLIGFYFYKDPFMVLYDYENYYPPKDSVHLAIDQDMVTMETFIKRYPTHKFDSYIFGSSRSIFYSLDIWGPKVSSMKCFHMNSFNESIYGMERKFSYLHRQNVPIKNALLVIDYELLKSTQNNEGMVKRHPILTGENMLSFQWTFFKSFLDISFIRAYLEFCITGKRKSYMIKYLTGWHIACDTVRNELSLPSVEKMIEQNPAKYYHDKADIFYKRDSVITYTPPVIKSKQKQLLYNIKNYLNKHSTNYKIVISPLYDQKKFHPLDLNELKRIFGATNVYDFSGRNEITEDIYNYYEVSHYRPRAAELVMNAVYNN